MANKYTSRAGVEIHAHIASPAEAGMQVRLPNGMDNLQPGDALVSLKGQAFVVRADLFAALFGADTIDAEDDTSTKGAERGLDPSGKGKGGQHGKGKGGQHEISVAHIPAPPDGTRSGA
jgi:hypothetical protein